MAEGSSHVLPQAVDMLGSGPQDEARNYPGNNLALLGRRPLSDSSIKYEENAFQVDSPEVKLIHFRERRNSFGDNSSDDGSKPSSSRGSIVSTQTVEQHCRIRLRKGAKTSYDCHCPQSQKAKRKAARRLSTLPTLNGGPFPVVPENSELKSRPRKKDGSFMKRVKKLFCDSASPTNFDNEEPRFSDSEASLSSKPSNDTEPSRSSKKELQKKDRHYIIGDIMAVTNCSYYWGSINRHEAEEVSNLYRFLEDTFVFSLLVFTYYTLY